MLAKADELVVLANDLRRSAGEVQREGSLVSTEVVDVEDQIFGQKFRVTPDHPANTRVDETVLVAGDVDADNLG